MSVLPARRLLLALAVCVLAPAPACSRRIPDERCPAADAGTPVDPALLAFLSRARAAHHSADLHEAAGNPAAAARDIEAVVNGPLPAPRDAAEVREVLADSHARLGELAIARGDFTRAEGSLMRGLELVPEPSYFRGHLVEVRGRLEEQRGKALEAKGDTLGAAQAKERALEAFAEAMRIQSDVIEKSAPKP